MFLKNKKKWPKKVCSPYLYVNNAGVTVYCVLGVSKRKKTWYEFRGEKNRQICNHCLIVF